MSFHPNHAARKFLHVESCFHSEIFRMKFWIHAHLPTLIRTRLTPQDLRFYLVLSLCLAISFTLGCWGFVLWYPQGNPGVPFSWGYVVYEALRLFVLDGGDAAGTVPWQLNVARFLSPILMLSSVIKIISEFSKDFWQELRAHARNHILIAGSHTLIHPMRLGFQKSHSVVTLQWGSKDTEAFIDKSWKLRGFKRDEIQQQQNALEIRMLQKAGIQYAKHLMLIHEKPELALHILEEVIHCIQHTSTPIQTSIHLHFDDSAALNVARQRIDASKLNNTVLLMNIYEIIARELIMRHPPEYRRGVNQPVHMVVVGANAMGRAMCIQTAFSGHFACLQPTQLTWLATDSNSLEQGKHSLWLSYPQIGDCLNFKSNTKHPQEFFASLDAMTWKNISQVWICLDNDVEGQAMQETIQLLARKALQGNDSAPEIICCLQQTIHTIAADENVLLRDQQTIDPMAKTTHENYRRKYAPTHEAGLPWMLLPRNLREANRRSAEHLWVKLRAVGWTKEFPALPTSQEATDMLAGNQELLSRMEKQRWNADRRMNGWVYGPTRDDKQRIHHLLVPWEQLDAEQQSKDTSNVNLIPELMKDLHGQ